MVDLFLSLSTAAITLSTLAPDLNAVDLACQISQHYRQPCRSCSACIGRIIA
ncbi:hypothetical protein J007_05484 [Cryptococcus neoformans]|nr:hypothetical protein C356_05547 [Cryptococcus neoformans var. grubii c45]OXB34861.1 hypothetical protein J007_05484 [Cryptococcus neoformans var. grubii]OXC58962.1 hypothetical protein C358_05602 [Cryptococcus neoformans var. grubii MW-RSA852]